MVIKTEFKNRRNYDAPTGCQVSTTYMPLLSHKVVGSTEYDYENMIKKITFPDGSTNEFVNCTCGTKRRVKIDSTGFTRFFFDEYQGIEYILQEYDQADVLKAGYTLGPRVDEIISKTTAEGTMYYHYNSLGSVTTLTDETGKLISKYEYEPFGQILSEPTGITNTFTFTGREYDKDSGLYFYRARYYAPELGRFLTRDPLLKTISTSPPDCATCGGSHISGCGISSGLDIYHPSDLHPYVYVGNDPVNNTDPKGLFLAGCAPRRWTCKGEWEDKKKYDCVITCKGPGGISIYHERTTSQPGCDVLAKWQEDELNNELE